MVVVRILQVVTPLAHEEALAADAGSCRKLLAGTKQLKGPFCLIIPPSLGSGRFINRSIIQSPNYWFDAKIPWHPNICPCCSAAIISV